MVEAISEKTNLKIEIDERLSERVLSTMDFPDWFERLKATFNDMDLKYEGGESSQEAMNRIVAVVDDVFNSAEESILIVTHGNLMSLLLKYYQNEFDFNCWKNLSNPDVFLMNCTNNEIDIERIWREDKIINSVE